MQFLSLMIISTIFLMNVFSIDVINTSTSNEIDMVIEMLLNNDVDELEKYAENKDILKKSIERDNPPQELVFSKGMWKCGKCDNIDESNLLYTETYDVANNDEENLDIQIGLSLQNMSCVIVKCKNNGLGNVKLLSGDCGAEGVTIQLNAATACDFLAYA